jgi:sterol desaturase/sphingolipid hydroxylase (fatty acid hydroxylase superfamily)
LFENACTHTAKSRPKAAVGSVGQVLLGGLRGQVVRVGSRRAGEATFVYLDLFFSHFSISNLGFMWTYFLAATVAALLLEFAANRKTSTIQKLWRRDISSDLKRDISIWSMEMLLIWPLLGKILTLSIGVWIGQLFNQLASSAIKTKLLALIPFAPLQILAALLLGDFVFYWLHRLFHKYPALWQLHKYHHSTREMSVFSGQRDNPAAGQLFAIFTGLPSAIFGSPPTMPSIVVFLNLFHSEIIHSQIKSDWGWIGRWLIVSPRGHLLHHSKYTEHHDKNFAFLFPIWDRIFGTYYRGDNLAVDNLGIDEEHNENSPFRQIVVDMRSCLGIVFASGPMTRLKAFISKLSAT